MRVRDEWSAMINLAIGIVALVLGVLFVLFWQSTLGVILGVVAILVGLGLVFRGYRMRASGT
ncbi:MAG: YtpI family protein [Thermoleophilia bacterium]|nr:hypothetical protein [Gaiellaceae bacterium]MDW8339205.1 YtpI family protein [Thermoleophilia bacterium]